MIDRNSLEDWVTWSFSPSISAILVTLLISLLSPILIHAYLYRSRASLTLPSFLLLGPSGAGKTSFLTLLGSGTPTSTHTSQEPHTAVCNLRSDTTAASAQFRSENDPSSQAQRKFQLIDTPGHGKLRHHATEALASSTNVHGLIYMVDAAAISNAAGLTEAATFLHDVLLVLQKRHTDARTSKGPASLPVLIAANKLDLFTALPAQLVKKALEEEITKIRSTRSKGLLDSAIGMEDEEEEREWLGQGGEGGFDFEQMEESEIEVRVLGGNVVGEREEEGHTNPWWAWIGENM